MSWEDRLERAIYVSADGSIRIEFEYTTLTQVLARKTSAYDFPAVGGTYVQDLGVGGRRFPFRIFLSGADYDLKAAAFDRAMAQRGPGTLQHPQLGALTVVPFGEVTRRDDLVTAGDQAIYELTFYETLPSLYPGADATEIRPTDYEQAQIEEFTNGTELETAAQQAAERSKIDQLTAQVAEFLAPIADNVAETKKTFDRTLISIETGVGVLLGQPATLAAQVLFLVKQPANASQLIDQTVRAHRDLITAILGGGFPQTGNDLQIRALYAGGALSGLSQAAVAAEYATRGEAVSVAAQLVDALAEIAAWRDGRAAGVEDMGDGYSELLQLVAASAARLIQQSFNLAQERRVILDRDRAIVDLAHEFYGDPERLDYLITTNGLTGSEILLVPRGRGLVYYV